MLLVQPYFLTNKEWYYYDIESGTYKLTNKAPQKAIDSYNEYYKIINSENDLIINNCEEKK